MLQLFKRVTLRSAQAKVWRTTVNANTVNSMLWRSTKAMPIVLGCLLFAPGPVWSDSVSNPAAGTQIDYGMPERLGRQVAPTPGTPWSAPDLRGDTSPLTT